MSEIEVKACPFCGGKGHISRDHCPDDTGIFYSIKCGSCGAKSGEKYASHGNDCGLLYQEVRDLWNNRPLESAKDARIAELEAENKRLREALERLGSTEAFSVSFFIKNNNEGNELRDRIDFARSFSKGGQ